MRLIDFSSWESVLTTVLGLALFALIGVGIRVLMLLTIQQRQQRMNRQINERLKTLIAAYRTLGGSFTGQLTVNPLHLRDQRGALEDGQPAPSDAPGGTTSDRPRRIRDAVEAALSDILLLGTEEHVRLAGQAAGDMAAGRPIHTAELVISLRNYIRKALDLDPIPESVTIPLQGPTRPQASGSRGGRGDGNRDGGGGRAGGGAGGAGGGGLGPGMGMGAGGADGPATGS
ncbi:hypothetical protein [Methylobrevis albus]|uniref:hypothetical protein n=1 Tax=Methylobrevis albus TaxID=2793297 RepID=UPI002E2BA0A7|nr:hypothetical protein [Methylobrevis albus]